MAKTGTTLAGHKLWTATEEARLRELFPIMTYVQMAARMKGRTWMAIRHKCQKMGLTSKRHVWTGAEIARLRKIYQTGTVEDIRAAFPTIKPGHLTSIANHYGIFRSRQPFKSTGIPAIDQIRQRAFDLGYSMVDVDHLARSRRYFANGGWHSGHLNHRAIARAIAALDGEITATWRAND